eukprot:TRINITY_DN4409_c0_g2_i1.p1 TRINITY_DN4409_c0_g2~~TRINITY_DN4409_c0_g2_i1.p1  ORF type:complete len:606 (-),score=105.49 TRINITY_DN4409_c0_g2_i1:133-1950(-)
MAYSATRQLMGSCYSTLGRASPTAARAVGSNGKRQGAACALRSNSSSSRPCALRDPSYRFQHTKSRPPMRWKSSRKKASPLLDGVVSSQRASSSSLLWCSRDPLLRARPSVVPFHRAFASKPAQLDPAAVQSAITRPVATQHALENMTDERRARLQELFSEYDANGDGSIGTDELRLVLESAVGGSAGLKEDEIRAMISIADLDNNGTVEFEEFAMWFEDVPDEEVSMKRLVEVWTRRVDLNDPTIIEEGVWHKLEQRHGKDNLVFPREIMWLGGAPGSGKGTNTPFIGAARGVTAEPIVMSNLLTSPSAMRIKKEGGLVGDAEVMQLLVEELLDPKYCDGAIVDGFPRTKIQVDILKLFYDHVNSLHKSYQGTELANKFKRPIFRMLVLYVDEKESIRRQLARGNKTKAHNEKVRATGEGELWEERDTDNSVKAAKARYDTFREQSHASLQSLSAHFPYHVLNATGTVEEVEMVIAQEMRYQSSLELQADTYETIKVIPTAGDISLHARQYLVERLDNYQMNYEPIFARVVSLIQSEFLPVINQHVLSGRCKITLNSRIFDVEPKAVTMLIDVFSDRDFTVMYEKREFGHRFDVRFETQKLLHG